MAIFLKVDRAICNQFFIESEIINARKFDIKIFLEVKNLEKSKFSPDKICIHPQMWKTVVDLRKIIKTRHNMVRSEVTTAVPQKIVANCELIERMSSTSSNFPTHKSLSSLRSQIFHNPIRPPLSDSISPIQSTNMIRQQSWCDEVRCGGRRRKE